LTLCLFVIFPQRDGGRREEKKLEKKKEEGGPGRWATIPSLSYNLVGGVRGGKKGEEEEKRGRRVGFAPYCVRPEHLARKKKEGGEEGKKKEERERESCTS